MTRGHDLVMTNWSKSWIRLADVVRSNYRGKSARVGTVFRHWLQ